MALSRIIFAEKQIHETGINNNINIFYIIRF